MASIWVALCSAHNLLLWIFKEDYELEEKPKLAVCHRVYKKR